jgi:hypothetical protein
MFRLPKKDGLLVRIFTYQPAVDKDHRAINQLYGKSDFYVV